MPVSLSSISNFIIYPYLDSRSNSEKGLAWATTIILGIGTIGVAQGLSALWILYKKSQNISLNIDDLSIEEDDADFEDEDIDAIEESHHKECVLLEHCWNHALDITSDNEENAGPFFIGFLEKFASDQFVLSANSLSHSIFVQNPHFKLALIEFAKQNGHHDFLNAHMISVAKAIYCKYVYFSVNNDGKPDELVLKDLGRQGRTLDEVCNNEIANVLFRNHHYLSQLSFFKEEPEPAETLEEPTQSIDDLLNLLEAAAS